MFGSKFTSLLLLGLLTASTLGAERKVARLENNALLNNIDSLQTAKTSGKPELSCEELQKQLAELWDWRQEGKKPLEVEVVFRDVKNGCVTEGLYFNGYGDEKGRDRVFCYYARPEKIVGKIPAYLQLTGGGDAESGLWMAGAYKCAIIDIEWRAAKNRFRSRWASGNFGEMKALTSMKENPAFRLVTGIRRAIDFLYLQPEIDRERIGCGGGSMGGYYTLLTAGVDPRVTYGMDELGAGYLAQTDSRLGQFQLDPQRKKLWLAAFDPFTYAGKTKARILMNLSANDYFFWLGDGTENLRALSGETRLCISPNFNHNDGAFGQKKEPASIWIPYATGRETTYPKITDVQREGANYRATAEAGCNITGAELCWSPGEQVVWPARYWQKIPALLQNGAWKATLPATYAGLSHWAFFNLRDDKGRQVSSVPMLVPGADAQPLWEGGKLWDTAAGPAAWRLIGPNIRSGVSDTQVQGADELTITPGPASKGKFSLVTNSLILASPLAPKHRGLKVQIDGKGQSGTLTLALVRNFGACQMQKEWTAKLSYQPQSQVYELPWSQFQGEGELFPFESLRIDGQRADKSALTIGALEFLD